MAQAGRPVSFRVCLTLYLNLQGSARVFCLSFPAKKPKAIPPVFFPNSPKVRKSKWCLSRKNVVSFYDYCY